MTKIDVDTIRLKECGANMVAASRNFNTDINNLYSMMYNVPRTTKEWVGIGANNYASIALKEKRQYVAYGNTLKKMGEILKEYAEDIESIVQKTKI